MGGNCSPADVGLGDGRTGTPEAWPRAEGEKMSLSSSAQHRPCAAPREALRAQLPGLGSALPPAPLELGRNAESRLPVILPASFTSGQCKRGRFPRGTLPAYTQQRGRPRYSSSALKLPFSASKWVWERTSFADRS